MIILVSIWLISFCAFIALCVRGIRLASSPTARAKARQHWLRSAVVYSLLIALALPSLWMSIWVYQRQAEQEAGRAAINIRLDAPTRLDGLDLPAGTQLRLGIPHVLASFTEAEFPAPVVVHGVPTRRIARDDRGIDTLLTVAAEQNTVFDGWHCLGSPNELYGAALRLAVPRDGSPVRLEECRTAEGNLLDGQPVPVNSTLRALGSLEQDGHWRISALPEEVIVLGGVPVFRARFLLDEARRLRFVEHAELACRLSLGDFVYPAGTELESADGVWRTRAPDAWAFMTTPARQAMRDGEPVEGGARVVQSAEGRLLELVAAAQAPLPRIRFRTEGVPIAPESSCDEMMSSLPGMTRPSQTTTMR